MASGDTLCYKRVEVSRLVPALPSPPRTPRDAAGLGLRPDVPRVWGLCHSTPRRWPEPRRLRAPLTTGLCLVRSTRGRGDRLPLGTHCACPGVTPACSGAPHSPRTGPSCGGRDRDALVLGTREGLRDKPPGRRLRQTLRPSRARAITWKMSAGPPRHGAGDHTATLRASNCISRVGVGGSEHLCESATSEMPPASHQQGGGRVRRGRRRAHLAAAGGLIRRERGPPRTETPWDAVSADLATPTALARLREGRSPEPIARSAT